MCRYVRLNAARTPNDGCKSCLKNVMQQSKMSYFLKMLNLNIKIEKVFLAAVEKDLHSWYHDTCPFFCLTFFSKFSAQFLKSRICFRQILEKRSIQEELKLEILTTNECSRSVSNSQGRNLGCSVGFGITSNISSTQGIRLGRERLIHYQSFGHFVGHLVFYLFGLL